MSGEGEHGLHQFLRLPDPLGSERGRRHVEELAPGLRRHRLRLQTPNTHADQDRLWWGGGGGGGGYAARSTYLVLNTQVITVSIFFHSATIQNY